MERTGVKPTTATRTVRDFKDFVKKETGTTNKIGGFPNLSEGHRAFWKKLNQIGGRNIESQPPEKVPDIDATVILSDEEWAQLESEFRGIREF